MLNIKSILAALLCAVTPFSSMASMEVANAKVEQMQKQILGKETIAALRQAYQDGEYQTFLVKADADYKRALADNDLDGLIEMRSKQIPVDFQQKWEEQFSALQKERNQELLAAISDKDNSLFAQKVRSFATDVSTLSQEKAIAMLNSLISKAPQTGANTDENTLIAIDLEYEYKILHAQLPYDDVSPQERANQQLVLRMEKMDKMLEASKNFTDHSLKQAVGLASTNLDARLSRNLDGIDLNRLILSDVKPANTQEEKIFLILTSYQTQFADLLKDIANENH